MKYILIFTQLILLSSCNSQNSGIELSGDRITDLLFLLPSETIEVDIFDGVKVEPRYEILYSKYISSIQENNEWFLQQMKISEETGEPMEYHKNFGLTKSEFEEFESLIKKGPGMEMVKNGTAQLTINHDGKLVDVKGNGRIEPLFNFNINLEDNYIVIDSFKLVDFQTIDVSTTNNGLKSKWKGYKWSYFESSEENILESMDSLADLSNLNAIQISVTIGQLNKDGMAYMQVSRKEFVHGEPRTNSEIPIKYKCNR